MKIIKNILVALDLSDMDVELIRYASFLTEKLGAEEVVFVHNIKKYEISELFHEQLQALDLDQVISEELDEKVAENFTAKAETEVLISEDHYTESLINYVVQRYMIDLVIIGNKNKHIGTGIISDKLLRLLKCDILTVPRNTPLELKNIWAGTDFSAAARKVFSRLLLLETKVHSDPVIAHIYNVPVQFSPYLEKEELVPRIEKHISQKFEKFLKKSPLDHVDTRIIRGRNATVPEKLSEEANKAGANLLMVADKGGNVFSSLLVGSITDELFRTTLPIPLWVVK